jgi:hypothetical protein
MIEIPDDSPEPEVPDRVDWRRVGPPSLMQVAAENRARKIEQPTARAQAMLGLGAARTRPGPGSR